MTQDIAVTIEAVSRHFPGAATAALDKVSLEIRKNEFFTLLGPSGCGKTTLLRMIAGFETPDQGQILLDGQAVGDIPPNQRPVNTVFQSYALFPHMSVKQNIAFGLEMLNQSRDQIRSRVNQMMQLVRLDELGDRRPDQLSGGQQQRVALARALAPAPRVLLLDEPLSALDLKLRKEMQLELKRLQTQTGITFVFVTHDQEEALTMSNRVAVMRLGRLMQVGTPQQIYEEPENRFVAEFIGEANFWPAQCVERIGDSARYELGESGQGGVSLSVAGVSHAVGDQVVLAVRPERISLVAEGAALGGTVQEVVYMGNDVMVHGRLDGGPSLRARMAVGTGHTPVLQQRLGFYIPPDAVKVFAA